MTFRYLTIAALVAVGFFGSGCSGKEPAPDEQPVETETTTTEATAEEGPVTQEVTFDAAGMTIHGELTLPDGDGPFPAIAIAAGSGPTDRNWESPMLPGSNGSAKLLGKALAENGVILLRYDKRGTGQTGMPANSVSWGDYVAELDAALTLLANHEAVKKDAIFVAGHSEGGAHALRTAATTQTPLAGVILLSTAGRSLRDVVLWQIGKQVEASGLNPVAQKAEMDALAMALDKIAAGERVEPSGVGQLPGIQQFVGALQNPSSVDFARKLLVYDPLNSFTEFELPVLVLSGGKDIQVNPQLDAMRLADAAKKAGRDTKFIIVEDADHVLKREDDPLAELTPQVGLKYNAEGRSLADGVVTGIVMWITER